MGGPRFRVAPANWRAMSGESQETAGFQDIAMKNEPVEGRSAVSECDTRGTRCR